MARDSKFESYRKSKSRDVDIAAFKDCPSRGNEPNSIQLKGETARNSPVKAW